MTPQQRSLATMLGFGVAAAVVAGYAYFGVLKADEAEGERKEVADKLFSPYGGADTQHDGGRGPPPEFTKVTVVAKGETTIVEKQPDGAWRMSAPVRGGVDQYALDGLLNQLRDGKVDERIEEKPTDADLIRYGLKPPQWIVDAQALVPDLKNPTGPKSQKQVRLAGGVENSFNASVYLQKDADPVVYAAGGSTRMALEKTAYDLRDKEVLAVDEPKISTVDVVRPKDGSYSLTRAADGKSWTLTKPKPMEADTQGINTLLGQLKAERALAFTLDSPDARKSRGMDAPVVDATFTMVGGARVRLRLAKVAASSEKVFALREDDGGALLAEVPVGALLHLDKSAADLRDKTVLRFNRDAVAELVFKPQGGGPAIAVKRSVPQGQDGGVAKAEAWTVSAPEQGPAKVWKVSSNLWTLGSLQAAELTEENPKSWDKYGINDKARQVMLLGADGKALATLTVGSEVKGKPGKVYVRGTRNAALEMDPARLGDLPTKLDDVIDRPAAADAGTL